MTGNRRFLILQDNLARAERSGDLFSMAKGYIILAEKLIRAGDRRLASLFLRRAGECLDGTGVPSACCYWAPVKGGRLCSAKDLVERWVASRYMGDHGAGHKEPLSYATSAGEMAPPTEQSQGHGRG
jgi:hypothetical protein